jgi:hypothetical protein
MHWRNVVGGLFLVVLVTALTYGSISSRNFQNCLQHQGQYPTAENKQNQTSPVRVPTPYGIRIFWSCSGGYANENGAAITALATVFLTILTGLLALLARIQFVTSRTQLSAFIFVEDMRAFYDIEPTASQPTDPNEPRNVVAWGFRPIWKNSGETQTRAMATHVDYEYRDRLLPNEFPFSDNNSYSAKMLMGPKSSALGGVARTFTVDEIRQVQAGTRFLYLWGWIRYENVFQRRRTHITRYCVQVGVIGDPSKSNAIFNFPVWNEGNCSDGECEQLGLG